jgi:WD40 repeat protein
VLPPRRSVVTASNGETAKIWDAETGKEFLTLWGYPASFNSAVFSSDGRRVITGSWDETAKIWDAETGKELLTLKGHIEDVQSAVFSPDGRRVLTTSARGTRGDKTAKIWDAVDWTLTKEEFLEQKHQRYVEWVKANVSQPE